MTEDLNFDRFSEVLRTDACESDNIKADRRTTHRTNSDALTYIHLEPDSGAIVLNVSDGGLAFHAVTPIHHSGTIKFWFSLRANHRIEGTGELAWNDATKKTGGLRFTALPAGVREQIRNWVLQPAISLKAESEVQIAAPGRSEMIPEVTPTQTLIAAAANVPPAIILGAASIALGRAAEIGASPAGSKASNKPQVVQASLVKANPAPKPRASYRGFVSEFEPEKTFRPNAAARRAILLKSRAHSIRRASTGLVFLAILIAVTALIYHQERHSGPVGVAQQFAPAGDLRAEAVTTDPPWAETDPPIVLAKTPISAAKSELASEISKLEAEYKEEPTRRRSPSKPRKSAPARMPLSATASESAGNPSLVLQPPATNSTVIPSSIHDGSPGSPLVTAGSGGPEVGALTVQTPTVQTPRVQTKEPQTPVPPDGDGPREVPFSGAGKYFDVGNFSDVVWAERARNELEQAGLHSLVIHKTRLWLNSYHVVVGPYSEAESVTAQEDLEARGFKPRLFK